MPNLFESGGAKGHTQSTYNYSSPEQIGYLRKAWDMGSNLANTPYSGPFIGAQSPWSVQGQQAIANAANDPNSAMNLAQRQVASTLSGDYLNPNSNPYFSQYVNDALGLAKSQFMSQYGGNAGANIGNSGYQEALGRALAAKSLGAYSNLYNTERQNQLAAVGMAPGADLSAGKALLAAGSAQEQRSQAEVEAQQQAYMEQWANLARYLQSIQGNYGGTSSGTDPYYTNPLGNIFGSASLLAAGMGGKSGGGGGMMSGMGGMGGGGSGAAAGGAAAGAGSSAGAGEAGSAGSEALMWLFA